MLLLSLSAHADDDVHLICKTDIARHPSTDSNVKESYDVHVKFLDDGAILNIDGASYALKQEYDARVSFYSDNPWYNLQIGNRNYATKYALGIPTNEPFARYVPCEEID